ncbi:MAG: thiopurine S-methyltransferase [Xanthomonadales bacterium]|nr:thiopurine S-methyltransferase [Xanthomonadales bacterium]
MEPDFWRQRWREGRIGFHRADVLPSLVRHWSTLGLPAGSTVFVPLCGKSRDMAWLAAQGHRVVGIELVGDALHAFFADEGLTPGSDRIEAASSTLIRHRAGAYTLYEGDLFDLDAAMLGNVAAIYDRAALIALPADLRRRYATHLDCIAPMASQLLVCLEYPDGEHQGPPFSIDAEAVAALYGAARVEALSRQTLPKDDGPAGVSVLTEAVYRIGPR